MSPILASLMPSPNYYRQCLARRFACFGRPSRAATVPFAGKRCGTARRALHFLLYAQGVLLFAQCFAFCASCTCAGRCDCQAVWLMPAAYLVLASRGPFWTLNFGGSYTPDRFHPFARRVRASSKFSKRKKSAASRLRWTGHYH